MALTVGTNSYVSVTDADEFIRTFYLPGETLYEWWDSLGLTEQETYLIRSAREIDRLPLYGYKTVATQIMMFPRNGDEEVPEEVIEAQIVNAYYVGNSIPDNPQNRGIKKYQIGNFSEEFFRPTADTALCSTDARRILSNWLTGGFRIV